MKGTSCCNECGAIEYCYFRDDKTKFSETGIAATFAISISIEVLQTYAVCRQEYVHLTASVYIGE